MRKYTKAELKHYFQTMKEKYRNSPNIQAFEENNEAATPYFFLYFLKVSLDKLRAGMV